jgi:hypothetical protein
LTYKRSKGIDKSPLLGLDLSIQIEHHVCQLFNKSPNSEESKAKLWTPEQAQSVQLIKKARWLLLTNGLFTLAAKVK